MYSWCPYIRFFEFFDFQNYFSRFFENICILQHDLKVISLATTSHLILFDENWQHFQKIKKNNFENRKIKKIECTHIMNTFPQHVAKVSEWLAHRQARQLSHIFCKNNFKLDFWGTVYGPLDRIPQISLELVSPAMDFREKVELWASLTLRCRRVWECSDMIFIPTRRDLAI